MLEMTISIGTSVNLNINLWGNGVFPSGCSSSFYLSHLGGLFILIKVFMTSVLQVTSYI